MVFYFVKKQDAKDLKLLSLSCLELKQVHFFPLCCAMYDMSTNAFTKYILQNYSNKYCNNNISGTVNVIATCKG
jgi:hypothetical protein